MVTNVDERCIKSATNCIKVHFFIVAKLSKIMLKKISLLHIITKYIFKGASLLYGYFDGQTVYIL